MRIFIDIAVVDSVCVHVCVYWVARGWSNPAGGQRRQLPAARAGDRAALPLAHIGRLQQSRHGGETDAARTRVDGGRARAVRADRKDHESRSLVLDTTTRV